MLAQRRRRWANISPALGQRLVFDRLHNRKHLTEMNGTPTDTDSQTALRGRGKPTCPHLCVQKGDIITAFLMRL